MKKVWIIGWKDLIVLFRDRGALILMLAAPFVLTVGLGLVTGAFSSTNRTGTGLAQIPVAIVNLDEGELGQALVDTLTGADLADLLAPVTGIDLEEARRQVDANELAAAVIAPTGFTAGVIPNPTTGERATAVAIEIYANPARPISAGVVSDIVQAFTSRVDVGLTSIEVTMTQLLRSGIVPLAQMEAVGQEVGARQIAQMQAGGAQVIEIQRETVSDNDDPAFNPLAYFAPGMAIIFLMYTTALGGRSFLDERNSGALARLLTTPTAMAQVLGGKVLGIFLSGVAQVGVLVLGSTLLFGLYWGDPLGVLLLILTVALAATGWGLLLAAFAKTPGQVTNYGTALMLIFGVLGGGFVNLPRTGALEMIARITPNAWALDGFLRLHQGGALGDITTELAALVIMGLALFGAAVLLFNRRSESILH